MPTRMAASAGLGSRGRSLRLPVLQRVRITLFRRLQKVGEAADAQWATEGPQGLRFLRLVSMVIGSSLFSPEAEADGQGIGMDFLNLERASQHPVGLPPRDERVS